MKRMLAMTVILAMLLAALTGCVAYEPSESEETQDPSAKRASITLTIAETLPGCAAFEYEDEKAYCFYAYDTEGKLYRVFWNDFTGLNENDVIVLDHNDTIKELDDGDPASGWMPKYEVAATRVTNKSANDKHLVSHIQIKSGDNTINPFGTLLWSKIDNGDGTFTELNLNVLDTVSMIYQFRDDIPKIVLDERISYLAQANGQVESVYLLTPDGDTYTKSKTTFEALSDLPDGTYYVALNVLLGGNCDPNAPQNSSRYEDIFCFVVGEEDQAVTSNMITFYAGDMLSQIVLSETDRQIILDILGSNKKWISGIPMCDWICRFSGSVDVGYCDCGTLSDLKNSRSRKLTAEEKKSIENLISRYG